MDRRNTRLRREYLYRKSNETQDRVIHQVPINTRLLNKQRKQELRNALDSGKPIPFDLKNDAQLKKDVLLDEADESPLTHVDDEYARAGVNDPKLLITTSRDPSSRLQLFAKEMKLVFPNAQRMNRGGYVMKEIVDACRSNEVTDLVILHEHRGQPDGMIVCHFPYGPTAYFTLHNVVLRHDVPDQGTVSEQYPHLIFDKFTSKLGQRVNNILKYLFPVPKNDSKRVMTFANQQDFISFRHHVYQKVGKEVELQEVGPRFEMQPYDLRLGTVEQEDADIEWTFRPYHRTAKKREFL